MHPQTLAALLRLAEVLNQHPDDAGELNRFYGAMVEHLADAIQDHSDEG